MLAFCNTKIVIGIRALKHAIRRCGGADGHDGGWTFGSCRLTEVLDGDHVDEAGSDGGDWWQMVANLGVDGVDGWKTGIYKTEGGKSKGLGTSTGGCISHV